MIAWGRPGWYLFAGGFLIIGLVLAWSVSRTNVPLKPLIQVTATLSYLSPPFLTAIAFTYLFSPNAGLLNVLMRDVLGLS